MPADEFAETKYCYAWPALAAAYDAFEKCRSVGVAAYESAYVLERAVDHFAACLKAFVELEHERDAKEKAKREARTWP